MKPLTYNTIIFDFDGTLADTAPGILATMRQTFVELGMPIPDDDAMRRTIGLPLVKALQEANNLSEADALRANDMYRSLFESHELTNIRLFPQVAETLNALHDRGLRMAIATSRNAASLDLILGRYGIDALFEQRVTNSDHLAAKPAPDMVLTLLRRMGLQASQALVVGDTTFDIAMGSSAGCHTCAVTYGNHTREQLLAANPTYVIDNIEQLLNRTEINL